MLIKNPHNKIELLERTRLRNLTVWSTLDWGGVMGPVSSEMDVLNSLYRPMVEGYIAETDETFYVRDYQKKVAHEQAQAELAQDRQLTDEKAVAEREILCIKLTTEEYVQAARLYDAQVRAFIMGAKEYAAEVERELVGLERSRAELAVAKEEAKLKEISAHIYQEYLNRAMVEADLARAKLDVLKAHTRVIMAGIEERRAEIQLVEAELKEAMVVAERATLRADVAMIFAEVIVKKLAEIRLAVETAEIEAGFTYIQQKLDDLLSLWETRTRIELLRSEGEAAIVQEVLLLLAAQKEGEYLYLKAHEYDKSVFEHEKYKTTEFLTKDQRLTDDQLDAKKLRMDRKNLAENKVMDALTAAKSAVNAAQRNVYKNHRSLQFNTQDMDITINK